MTRSVLWMQAGVEDPAISYAAIDDRLVTTSLWATEGVISGGLKVSQRGAGANFSVDVAAGMAVVSGDDVTGQGTYLIRSDAVENVTIPSPPVSGSRIHRVVAQVRDKLHNSSSWSTYEWTIDVLEDTGSGTPALPASAISLALVTVAAGQVSVTDSNIQDFRPNALSRPGRPRLVADSASRPVRPVEAEGIWRQDLKDAEVYDGSQWWQVGINPPAAILTTLHNQNVANTTATAVNFESEVMDTHNGHSTSSNITRYVAPQSGVYRVDAVVPFVSNTADGKYESYVRVNGSTTWLAGYAFKSTANLTPTLQAGATVRLNQGDYIELVVWQGSGATRAIDCTFNGGPRMEIEWRRPL